MNAASLALAALLLGQVNVTIEPRDRSVASSEPSCRRRCAAVEKALARADLSRPESLEPLVAAWERLVADRACVLPAFQPCWPERWRGADGEWGLWPAWAAIERLVWLATPVDGVRPPDHRALRVRAQRALANPCTVAAFDEELNEFGSSVLDVAEYLAYGVLTEGELFAALRARAPRADARASSTLASSGRIGYAPRNVLDGSTSTAWCEGKEGPGIGEWIEISVLPGEPAIRGAYLVRGYAKDLHVFRRNDFPVAIRAAPCDAPGSGEVSDLRDSPESQFEAPALEPLGLRSGATRCIRFTIVDIARAKDSDACFTEIVPLVPARNPPWPITSVPGPAERCPPGHGSP